MIIWQVDQALSQVIFHWLSCLNVVLVLYQGPFILLLKATFEKLSCSLPPLVHSLLFSCITLVSSILIYNIFMSNIFLSGSLASFCLYLLPSNYQSLFSPDLLDVRKIFKVLVNTNLNHFHDYLLNSSIEFCKNFSDNL